jgi:hypothetical protein
MEALINHLLELDTGSEKFVYELFAFVKDDLGKLQTTSGGDAEKQLMGLLAERVSLNMQAQGNAAAGGATTISAYRFDLSRLIREQMLQALEGLNHTRFRDVVDAFAALGALEQNASDAAAIEKLKAAIGKFVIPEPPPPPKKGAKQTVAPPPSIKDVVGQIASSIDGSTLTELRFQMLPFISESLLGVAYASMLASAPGKDSPYAGMVRLHELGATAWGSADFDAARKAVRGNLARLGYALAALEPRLNLKDEAKASKDARPDWTALILHSFQSVDYRKSTDRALEFVTRVIDLGEDTLVLYAMGDQTAQSVTTRLETMLSARRAQIVRLTLEGGEVKRAISELSLSELYQIGLEYLKLRLAESPAAELAKEPGALGTVASVIVELSAGADSRSIPQAFNQEVNQFGLPVISHSGFMRLELGGTDTYEQSQMFKDGRRGLERLQDFKLAIARVCYRQGFSADVALSPILSRAALEKMRNEIATTPPPDRDWQDAITLMQSFNEKSLKALVASLVASNNAALQSNNSWSEEGK